MPAPRTVSAPNLTEYTRIVESIRATTKAPIWFRGIGSTQHKLVPSLFRHPSICDVQALIELEAELLTRFRHRSIPYQSRPLTDSWELFFMMQHFGVPTRLLDWSENPFIALYFAIVSAEARISEGIFSEDAAIWILNTRAWNGRVLSPYWKGRVVAHPDNPLEAYTPGTDLLKLAELPVAMAGLHNSPRIVAQRGAFTIFGHNSTAMEDLYSEYSFPDDALVRVVIPKDNLTEVQGSLFGIGYADSMIYPDLAGLAKEMRRQFGFGV